MAEIAPPNLHPLNNSSPLFTEEALTDINEWFDTQAQPILVINDDEPILVISVEQFQNFMDLKKFHRRDYYYPTYGEIMLEMEKLNMGTKRVLTQEQFVYMLNKWVIQPKIKKELLLAFQVFDTEKRSYLDIEELVHAVTLHGDDAFNESEKLELNRDANTRGDGVVYYEDFIESMFNIFPELYDLEGQVVYSGSFFFRSLYLGSQQCQDVVILNNVGNEPLRTWGSKQWLGFKFTVDLVEYLYLNPDEDPSVSPLPPEPESEPEPEVPPPPPPPKEKKRGRKKGKKRGKERERERKNNNT